MQKVLSVSHHQGSTSWFIASVQTDIKQVCLTCMFPANGVAFSAEETASMAKDLAKLQTLTSAHLQLPGRGVESFWCPQQRSAMMFALTTEWLDGENLRQVLNRDGRLSEVHTVAALLDALEGLSALHDAGLFHLRLRPAAIMRTHVSGRAVHRLLEVGISGLESSRSTAVESDNPASLEQYQSPEFRRAPVRGGKGASQAMDLWSLSVTTYEMMTGDPPWTREQLADEDPAEMPNMYEVLQVGECSEKLHRFVSKGLAREPNQRFQTATEMREQAKETQFSSVGLFYDAFLSYRVRPDADKAQALFKDLSSRLIGDLPVYIFLDKVCLVDGERWDHGFMTALSRSRVFVPLLSPGAIERMESTDADAIDNVLLEWSAAIELQSRSGEGLQMIVPLFFDDFRSAVRAKTDKLQSHAAGTEARLRKYLLEITGDDSITGLLEGIGHFKDSPQGKISPIGVIRTLSAFQGTSIKLPAESLATNDAATLNRPKALQLPGDEAQGTDVVIRSIASLGQERAHVRNAQEASANGATPTKEHALKPGRRLEAMVVDALRLRVNQLAAENKAVKAAYKLRAQALTRRANKHAEGSVALDLGSDKSPQRAPASLRAVKSV